MKLPSRIFLNETSLNISEVAYVTKKLGRTFRVLKRIEGFIMF